MKIVAATETETPIEMLAAKLPAEDIGEVLAPEGCMEVWLNGAWYHVTIEKMP